MARRKEPWKVTIIKGPEIPEYKLQALKKLIKKIALRKIKELEDAALKEAGITELLHRQ